SKLVSAPHRVKASLATSRMRSRLRWASVRGFRPSDCERLAVIQKNICNRRQSPLILSTDSETLSVLFELAAGRQDPLKSQVQGGREWQRYLARPQPQKMFCPGLTWPASGFL